MLKKLIVIAVVSGFIATALRGRSWFARLRPADPRSAAADVQRWEDEGGAVSGGELATPEAR